MEKKSNNGIVITLMGVIIAILAVLCVLFATDTITFNKNELSSNDNISNINNKDNKNIIMTKEEAKSTMKSIVENETVRHLYDNPQITYCKNKDEKKYTERELGLNYTWSYLQKCNDFNTYEELVEYFKNYFTEEYYNNNLENKHYATKKSTVLTDGIEYYNYYEKDGSLYVASTNKGSNLSKDVLYNVNYEISLVEENRITGNVTLNWLDASGNFSENENIDIELIKDDNNWKINKYELK